MFPQIRGKEFGEETYLLHIIIMRLEKTRRDLLEHRDSQLEASTKASF
jgi:hypothetical protein